MNIKTAQLSILLLTFLLLALPVQAQNSIPDKVEITCITDVCLSDEKQQLIEGFATEILAKLNKYNFTPLQETKNGNRLGNFIIGRDGSSVLEIIYDDDIVDWYADAKVPCPDKNRQYEDIDGRVRIGAKFNNLEAPFIYLILAHEIFHTFQFSQPVFIKAKYCDIPNWVGEGSATFVGLKLMHERFGKEHPQLPLSHEFAEAIYGLRSYYISLTAEEAFFAGYMGSDGAIVPGPRKEKRLAYRGASFWEYIADKYHQENLGYLAKWMQSPMVGSDDWLAWLNKNLINDNKIDTKLYMVFADFLANFSTWAPEKYKHLKKQDWLNIAFYGCTKISLSPDSLTQKISLNLEPLSGKCLLVGATGISPSNVAKIKIMAEDEDSSKLDNLHLSGALLSTKVRQFNGDFNCYRETRKAGREPACLDKPFTGKHSSLYSVNKAKTRLVKTWLSLSQIPPAGKLENLYILSHSPLKPSDSVHLSRETQAVELIIGLEETISKNSAAGKSKRASSIINLKPGQPVPMLGSEDAASIAAEDRVSKAAYHISKNTGLSLGIVEKGILSINFTDRDMFSDSEDQLVGGFSASISPYDMVIPFGAKGKFPAKLSQAFELHESMDINNVLIIVPEDQVMGSIEVIEFSNSLLHLKVKGHYCRVGNLDKKTRRCNKIETVTATIIKPFGWAYDGAQNFISIDTPGMAEYRRVLTSALGMGDLSNMPDLPGLPGGITGLPGMPGGQMGGMDIPDCVNLPQGISREGYSPSISFCSEQLAEAVAEPIDYEAGALGQQAACDCSCGEMKKLEKLRDSLMAPPASADGKPNLAALDMSKLSCIMSCAKQYAACK